LKFLLEVDWLSHFPEIDALRQTPQDPEWHPEGDVFVHTGLCCDALATLDDYKRLEPEAKAVLMLATLCHDLGKATTTEKRLKGGRERITSYGHEEAGAPLATNFLKRIGFQQSIIERVVPLVRNHLVHFQTPSERSIRRLARRLFPETIEHLALLMRADHMGRPPRPPIPPPGVAAMLERAMAMNLASTAPQPLLKGRHLIERGLSPGPDFSKILEAAFEAQLEGAFADLPGGRNWLEQHLDEPTQKKGGHSLPKSTQQ